MIRKPLIRAFAWLLAPLLTLLVACGPAAPVKTSAATAPAAAPASLSACLDRSHFALLQVMPAPPAAGSALERRELDEMLQVQATRTTAQVDRVRGDADIDILRFSDALGSAAPLDSTHLPLTIALFRAITADETQLVEPAKQQFARPRPYVTETRLQPVVPKPASASYPSGHSTWGTAVGFVLADMVPERHDQLVARAEEFGNNRIVGGVHYPSDVEAGRLAGAALATLLFSCPEFRTQEAAAATELRGSLGLPSRHQ
ncbi:MAG TPA: phosphatase PAP2 family protein [Steroidobacteraceae bacterium]|nr:phosphatase PAP2 family protein [Steroidobacteraceae bacterium]